MKLVIQIALGVFLGTMASQFAFESWRSHQEYNAMAASEKRRTDQQRARLNLNARIREAIMQSQRVKSSDSNTLPPGFIPDDASGQPTE